MARESHVRVLLVEKDGIRTTMRETRMPNIMEDFQKYVGGYIEVTSAIPDGTNPGRPLHMVIHETGKLEVRLNPTIGFAKGRQLIDYVAGKAIFVSSDAEGDFCSLTDKEIEYIKNRYSQHGTLDLNGEPHHILVFSG